MENKNLKPQPVPLQDIVRKQEDFYTGAINTKVEKARQGMTIIPSPIKDQKKG